ncbi:MAG TPA: efflux RND transporter periplasmic adaptor subunit [Vicinamibacterales bacterium]
MRIWKNTRLLAVVLVIAAIAAMALWPETAEVETATAVRGPMLVTINEDGRTRVTRRFVISAPLAGRLQRIELEPGDTVTRGRTVLARLLPLDAPLLDPRARAESAAAADAARAAVGQAQAERDRASATLERARTHLDQQQALLKGGAVARDDVDAAATAVRNAEAAFRAAEFAVSRARYELQLAGARLQSPQAAGRAIDITAPVDGVVLRRIRESEAVVAAGEPLLEIGTPEHLEVVADLLSTDATRVSAGNRVLIDHGSGTLEGSVRRVEPSGFTKVSALGVEEQRVNVVIDFLDPAGAARVLGDGYRVEARVVVWQADMALKVPVGALFRQGDDWAVFVMDGGRAQARTVQVGQRNNEEAQILDGLAEGATLILHPPDTLTEGTRVRARAR